MKTKESLLKAYEEGKTIQSNFSGDWKDFEPHNQLDRPNFEHGSLDNWRIKPQKRQLIETHIDPKVVCDNPSCDYTESYTETTSLIDYVNKPCPKCGENLCTEQDYKTYMGMMKTVKWLNKWFSWLTWFYSKKSYEKNQDVVSIHVHDGIKVTNLGKKDEML